MSLVEQHTSKHKTHYKKKPVVFHELGYLDGRWENQLETVKELIKWEGDSFRAKIFNFLSAIFEFVNGFCILIIYISVFVFNFVVSVLTVALICK